MQTKTKVILILVALTVTFGAGRFAAPTKEITVTKTVEVEKKVEDKTKENHKKTTVTETTAPDGTKTKTTVITDESVTKTEKKDDISKNTDTTKEITRDSAKVTVSALVATNITGPYVPDYGLSITKPILGPLTIGIFGFRSGNAGVSVGLTF